MTGRRLAPEFAVVADDDTVLGYLVPEIDDDAPHDVREGMVRRRLCATEGRCPCGAVVEWPNRAERRRATRAGFAARIVVEHEVGCPAGDRVLGVALARWVS